MKQRSTTQSLLKQGVALAALTLGLSACTEWFGGGLPRVTDVSPANGETNVALSSNVRASLTLPSGSGIDVTTLTDTSVTLTDASGVAVSATRTVEGDTLVLDPTTDLTINTSYTFNVTSEVRTADGTALQPFSSTFSTGTSGDGGTGLFSSPERVVFTAGGATSSDTRTLTLSNAGTETVNVSGLSVTGTDAAQFALTDSSTFSLAPGASRELSLTFDPSGLGPQFASLSVQSDDPTTPNLEVPLGGLSVEGQGGNKEPSLQWILDTYGLPVDTGDEDPSTFNLVDSPTNALIGDEVAAQYFTKASPTEPVTAEVLAAFGVENDPVLEFGYYTAGQAEARTGLFDIAQTPTLNAQRLAPDVTATGSTVSGDTVTFDPGAGNFGLYSFWPTNRFFSQRYVYTEDDLNTFSKAIPHQVRTYPLPGEANAYVVATEEFSSGFDYNDVVVILRNVTPLGDPPGAAIPPKPSTPPASGIAGLGVSNALGLPYSDRLVLQKIESTAAPACDPAANPNCDPNANRYDGIEFPTMGTVTLQNTGSVALQLSLSFLNDNLFVLRNGESSLTLQPGQTYELMVEFNPQGYDNKGVYPGGLLIQSGGQSAGLELAGLYMLRPEGSREVFLAGLTNELFGYNINLGATPRGGLESPETDSPLSGDEVRSDYWEAADPNSSVSALQLAAFHTCCGQSYAFELYNRGSGSPFASMKPADAYGQSIYPRQQDGDLTQLTADPSGAFEIRSADYSSDPNEGTGRGRLGVRFWPLRDRSGNPVPNTYLVGQDFVRGGCQSSNPAPTDPGDGLVTGESDTAYSEGLFPAQSIVANCDYNDNMYIISNIKPVN